MLGASLGALVRWWLSVKFNAVSDQLFLGTLLANVIACGLMGFLLGYETAGATINTALRIAFLTGFLGSLSTFSTFIAEAHSHLVLKDWFKLILGINLQIGLGLITFYFARVFGQAAH
ncbi:MAG: CrcB family protein [Oceanospirillaceae bacterium]|nr:CrcB family protein [Oceanospirillaceae bacterium]